MKNKVEAQRLQNQGYTMRQIAKLMGLRSPASVHRLLK